MTSLSKVYIRTVNPDQLFSFKTFVSFLASLGKNLVDGTSWSAHGGSDSTVIKRRQQQLGRMADFLPSVTFSVFDL